LAKVELAEHLITTVSLSVLMLVLRVVILYSTELLLMVAVVEAIVEPITDHKLVLVELVVLAVAVMLEVILGATAQILEHLGQ
jgi:hypothetical protein